MEETVNIIRMLVLTCVAGVLLNLFPCLAASEKAFTATEAFCYSCVCANCDPGTIVTLANGNLQLRNKEAIYFYTSSDSRVAGYLRIVFNSDTDPAFNGTIWGTFYACNASGNRLADGWEGTWNGQIFGAFPSNWISRNTGYGTGVNSGLKLEFTSVYGDSLTGTIVGVIQDSNK
jgi:hypothetical protein